MTNLPETDIAETDNWVKVHPVITESLQFLKSCCNGAITTDGTGFNKLDTEFADSLISQINDLSPNQHIAALKMLKKYQRTQLIDAGLTLPTQTELMRWLGKSREVVELDEEEEEPDPYAKLVEVLKHLDFEPTEQQREALERMHLFYTQGRDVGGKYFGLFGFAGSGKLQPLTEPVLTPTGWKPMGDITVGDFVISQDGKPTRVFGVFPGSDLEIYKVHFSDGSWTECCIDHLWRVQTKKQSQDGTYQVLSLKAMLPLINEGSRRSSGGHNKGYVYRIDLCEPVQFAAQNTPIHPYLLGWLLGDGYLPTRGAITIATWDKDSMEIAGLLDQYLPDGVTSKLEALPPPGTHVQRYSLTAKIKPLLKGLGLLAHKSAEKFVPPIYLYNSVECRKAMLAGLLDTDGTVSRYPTGKTKTRFNTSSKQLALDVLELVRSLGGRASLYIAHREKGVEYHVYIRLPFNPFILSRKKWTYGESQGRKEHFKKQIVRAEYIGQKDGQCIAVEHPSQLYLTRDYTVTHNTTILQMLVKALTVAGDRPFICMAAPTNKAVRVLQKMAKNAGLRDVDFKTIHQLLQLQREIDEYGKEIWVPRVLKKRHDVRTSLVDYDLVLVDESSMIGETLWNQIQICMDVISSNDEVQTQVIAIGDPAQLPPIEKSRRKKAFEQDLDFSESESLVQPEQQSPLFTEIVTSVLMTQVMRYNGALLRLATNIRENLDRTEPLPFKDFMDDSTQILLLNSEEWIEKLIADYKSPEYQANPAALRAIAYRNKTVSWLNTKVRTALLGREEALKNPYLPGDRLVMLSAVFSGKIVVIPSRSEVEVFQVTERDEILGTWEDDGKEDLYYKHWAIKGWDEDKAAQTLRVIRPESKPDFERRLAQLHSRALSIPTIEKEKRRKAFAEFYDHKALFAQVDYAFCLTVHSAQGSTFNRVYIPMPDLMVNRKTVERNKLLYTAITRAAHQVIVAL